LPERDCPAENPAFSPAIFGEGIATTELKIFEKVIEFETIQF